MNRTEFITVTTIILFAVFVLGWFACWLIQRLTRPAQADLGELARMSRQLQDVRNERDTAAAQFQEQEAALKGRLASAEAELESAITGLHESRSEIEELRDYIQIKLARR